MTAPPAVVTNYTYDAAGNRLTAGANTYTYDQRNRLLSGGGTTYNWSPRGTLVSTTGTAAATYVHDGLDRLTQTGTVTYAYDSLDRVTTRTVGGVGTAFSYAGTEMDPVAEGTTTKYLRGPSGQSVHGIIRNGTTVFAGADRHGDVSFTLSTTGAVTDTKIVDPFGKSLGATGTAPNIGFQSDYTDPTSGLVWMGARWYNPNTATFTARDTYPGEIGAYATLNRYTYGLNNPLTYSDPTGRYAMDADGGGGGNAAPAGCDNACQYAHLQETGNLFDDAGDSYNDRFQNGDLDATTEIYEDGDGQPVFIVVTDEGIAVSSVSRTERSSLDQKVALVTAAPIQQARDGVALDDRQVFIDQGNCKMDEHGNLLPPRDPRIYQCEDMSAEEREEARKRARNLPENKALKISPDLTASQWFDLFSRTARIIAGEKQARRRHDSGGSTFGKCVGGGASLFYGIEAQTCDISVNGESVQTKSIGYSIGPMVSIGIGGSGLVSNAKNTAEFVGWTACVTGSVYGTTQVCISIGFDPKTGETTVPTDNVIWTISGGFGKGVGGGFSKGIVYTEQVLKPKS